MAELVTIIIVAYIIVGTLWVGVIVPAWEAWRRR